MNKQRIDELMKLYRRALNMGEDKGWFEQTMFAMDGYRKLYNELPNADITKEQKAEYKAKIETIKGVF